MSKPSAKPAPLVITRKQQIAALRTMKAQEVASNVAKHIREAVEQEVEKQLAGIKASWLGLIDKVADMEARNNLGTLSEGEQNYLKKERDEGDSNDRQERAEALEVQQDIEVVPNKGLKGGDHNGGDGAEGPASR